MSHHATCAPVFPRTEGYRWMRCATTLRSALPRRRRCMVCLGCEGEYRARDSPSPSAPPFVKRRASCRRRPERRPTWTLSPSPRFAPFCSCLPCFVFHVVCNLTRLRTVGRPRTGYGRGAQRHHRRQGAGTGLLGRGLVSNSNPTHLLARNRTRHRRLPAKARFRRPKPRSISATRYAAMLVVFAGEEMESSSLLSLCKNRALGG